MKRRDFIKDLGMGAAGAALGGTTFGCRQGIHPAAEKPNLIYVFADQLRAQSVGYMGDTKAMTPHLDDLAAEGINFSQAVSNTPVCAAHRASLFTGKHTSSTGMVINELRMNPGHRCFGHVLTENGYATGYIGKWHLWSNRAGHHQEAESSYIPPDKHNYRLGFDGYWAAYNFNHQYYKAFYFQDEPERIRIEGYEPDVQTDMAISFLADRARDDRPFALFLSFGTPHDPWRRQNVPGSWYDRFRDIPFSLPETWTETPDPYMDRFTDPVRWQEHYKVSIPEFQRVYYAMTANLDWNVGRLLAAVDRAGIARDTLIVFSSDHGEMFGAHGRVQKMTFYEEAVRVPFLMRWPGVIPGGRVTDACLGTPDIMPTVLGLLGLPIPRDVEGMDLSGIALGKGGPEPEAALLQGMGHTYLWRDGFEWRGLRDKRFTFARYRCDGSELLFDNMNDPLQRRNLIGDPAWKATAERIRERMRERMESLNDTFELCTWYRDHWTDGDRNILRGARG
jgi:arylsulfatase A-like enzyme